MKFSKDTIEKINAKIKEDRYFKREYEAENSINGAEIKYCSSRNGDNSWWNTMVTLEQLSDTIEDLEKLRDILKDVTGITF